MDDLDLSEPQDRYRDQQLIVIIALLSLAPDPVHVGQGRGSE
jgi:hypothetical protein